MDIAGKRLYSIQFWIKELEFSGIKQISSHKMTSREKLSFQNGKKLKSIGMRSYVKCKRYI